MHFDAAKSAWEFYEVIIFSVVVTCWFVEILIKTGQWIQSKLK